MKIKLISILVFIFFMGNIGYSQLISTGATIVDSDGQSWNNGSWSATLVNNQYGGVIYCNGSPANMTPVSGQLDGTGSFTTNLYNTNNCSPAGTLYKFIITPNASSTANTITIAVTSSNLSSSLNPFIQAPRFVASPTARGYLDIEVINNQVPGSYYYNVSMLSGRIWNGTAWVNSTGSGSGTVQAAAQGLIGTYPTSTPSPIIGGATTGLNSVAPLLQGLGNSDLFRTNGTGQDGMANFLATYPTGKVIVPPTSNSTEADFVPPSGAAIVDTRGNTIQSYYHNPTQTNVCLNSGFYAAVCSYLKIDGEYTNEVYDSPNSFVAGPGYNSGNNGTSAQGWSVYQHSVGNYNYWTRGIKQVKSTFLNLHAIGDGSTGYDYIYTDGGFQAASDEGVVGRSIQVYENSTYFHGTIATGGTTGSNQLTTVNTSGQNNFTDGGYLLDITKSSLTGLFASLGTVMGYPVLNFTSSAFPVSTAWGTSNTNTTSAADGKFQHYVSQTINFTLGTSPASPGPFVVGNNACIDQKFFEQVAITAVGTPSAGVQSVTFLTRYGYNAGALLMQGGMCGQGITATGSTWRTTVPITGSFSSSQVVDAGCTPVDCFSTSNLYSQTINPGNTVGFSSTFYPIAEIIGTDGGQFNNVQLATNTVPFSNGDVIEGPHPASIAITGLSLVVGQTTPVNGAAGFHALTMVNSSATPANTTNNSGMIYSITNQPIWAAWNLAVGDAGAYDRLVYSTTTPDNGVLDYHDAPDNTTRIYEGAGGVFYYVSGGTFSFLGPGYSSYTVVNAQNIPAAPVSTAQIPVATTTGPGANPNYQPKTPGGAVTMDINGNFTLTQTSNIQITLPTTTLTANTCSTPATAALPGVIATSTFTTAFATNPNAVTGYGANAGITISLWPTTDTVNWSICNATALSITPGAMTINVGIGH